jgi:Skp family chaperone for outer membrane proteins
MTNALVSRLAASALAVLLLAPAAMAQDAIRVGTANPAKIFDEIRETQDLKTRLEAERKLLEQSDLERKQRLRDLQEARNQLRPDSPQYQQRNQELMQAGVEYEVWVRMQQAELGRRQKEQLRTIFDKIAAAVSEVASQKGFDLIVSDQRPPIPENLEQIDINQLRELINRRTVLYSAPKADISEDVIALLNARYVAAPAPAPAPAP